MRPTAASASSLTCSFRGTRCRPTRPSSTSRQRATAHLVERGSRDARVRLPRSERPRVSLPIYKGTYERRVVKPGCRAERQIRDLVIAVVEGPGPLDRLPRNAGRTSTPGVWRSTASAWAPLRRRDAGAWRAASRTAVLVAGGSEHAGPSRGRPAQLRAPVRHPVLMLNGRYDSIFPHETIAAPALPRLGTPEERQEHYLRERPCPADARPVVSETLDWLDRYLGTVATGAASP